MNTFYLASHAYMAPWVTGPLAPYTPWFIIALVIWELIWKGIALWYAARNNQRVWYVFILILNTVGILSILYIAFFRKNRNNVVHTTTVTHTVTASTPGAPEVSDQIPPANPPVV